MSRIGILLIAATIVMGLAALVAIGFLKLLLLGVTLAVTVALLAMVGRKLYRNSRVH
jgi:hypothetical protein